MSLGEGSDGSTTDDEVDNAEPSTSSDGSPATQVVVGEYTWADYEAEFPASDRPSMHEGGATPLDAAGDEQLTIHPDRIDEQLGAAMRRADQLDRALPAVRETDGVPVTKGIWTWHDHVRALHDPEHADGSLPADFDPAAHLGFAPADLTGRLAAGGDAASALADLVDERTVNVAEEVDEDAFFSTVDGATTIVNRYDLEKAVPREKKRHFYEQDRYWVNKPFAFVVLFHSEKENEKKYYLIEPHLSEIEEDVLTFLTNKLRTSIKYSDEVVIEGGEENRRRVIEEETTDLLRRYDIYDAPRESRDSLTDRLMQLFGRGGSPPDEGPRQIKGITARPEAAVLAEDAGTLTEYQVEKLLYRLKRDFTGYERIDGIKHDINVEDISCDGYNSPVFVYHTDHEQIITNVHHGKKSLDDFVVKLAQRSGKGISKRQPQVDATLPDGSRAQLTLGQEVSDRGTNYTIRQFKDVPFTPIDLINWRTFSLEEMAFLWLCIENDKSLIFAGGTASGKTTSLNAVSLFIPSNTKIVSIEDTREVELPQRNWIASVTRPSFSDDSKGDVDEFDLLEAALRQRPDYIVMGEIRGEEGRTLFQVMSTGHTTYTTFHADSVGEVLKRFTTAPINVSKTMFTALDLVSIQTSTRVQGRKVRRNKSLTEINHYDPENDEINVRDVYQWRAETDEFVKMGDSNTLDEILFDRGWDREQLEEEQFKREVVLAYLIQNGLSEYREVAATLQAFITDPDSTFSLIASGSLEDNLEDLREMESVQIDVDPEKEAMVPRPEPDDGLLADTADILAEAEDSLFSEYDDAPAGDLGDALSKVEEAAPERIEVAPEAATGEIAASPSPSEEVDPVSTEDDSSAIPDTADEEESPAEAWDETTAPDETAFEPDPATQTGAEPDLPEGEAWTDPTDEEPGRDEFAEEAAGGTTWESTDEGGPTRSNEDEDAADEGETTR